MTVDVTTPRSRRNVLLAAFAGVGAVAAQALRPFAALANDTDPVLVGSDLTATSTTRLSNVSSDVTVLEAVTNGGGTALAGTSHQGVGVVGISNGVNLIAEDGNAGIIGAGHRGGMFFGSKAAVNLAPSAHDSHPHSGFRGDLVVDATGRLWFCKGGTHWAHLA